MKPRPIRRAGLIAGLVLALALVAAGVYIGVSATRGPDPAAVESSFRTYVESMAVSGKIVLVEARQRVIELEAEVAALKARLGE